ncbi:dihydrofolate synthase / folylpolyglutamate synthase [Haloechinothrix alba]|uniref:Dihydrofolate synthase/folylpolyglutamate synthase n=1 Tax=Haloechinothrix alba TaxID=664784 RepID=A0A238XK44_9PSEU|nr:folylpolyglutamate synthase/dihydrofolate synthase family protein [Haloechinothrix alba]SNR59297.1 dihydrofolate synthase / folylpolyglutamate synthase [Haloechinothrix alba]
MHDDREDEVLDELSEEQLAAGPMPDTPEAGDEPIEPDPEEERRAQQELLRVEAELNQRWGETKIAPTLKRITALLNMMGEPHATYPLIQIAGTNGKGSVARMVDALLTRMGLRVGRYTSPHLQVVTERISVDGSPVSASTYVDAYADLLPFVSMVDEARAADAPRMTKFEVLTALAFSIFADAPVEVAVLETGMGGTWDATNVGEAQVAAITPVSRDHVEYLGSDVVSIAKEKAGVIGKDGVAVVAEQDPEVLHALMERAVEVDATVARAGHEFGVLEREKGVGGQQLKLQGLGGVYEDIFLPVHGEHQAANAALALATVEAFFGAGPDRQLVVEAVREAFADLTLPGRLEPVRGAPTVLLDAAHNPHSAQALAATVDAEFAFRRLVAVIGVLDDKDAHGILEAIEPVVSDVVVTRNASPRALEPEALAEIAIPIFGEDRVHVHPRLDLAVESAVALVEHTEDPEEPLAGGGVLITGSVVTAGEARALFGKDPA